MNCELALYNLLDPIKSPRGLTMRELIEALPEYEEGEVRATFWVLRCENKLDFEYNHKGYMTGRAKRK